MKVLTWFVFLSVVAAHAEVPEDPSRPGLDALRRDGQLISVRLAPGSPLKIFVVGREEAKLDLAKLKLTVRRLEPGPETELLVRSKDGYFAVEPAAPEKDQPQALEVSTKLEGKTETFRFRLKSKP